MCQHVTCGVCVRRRCVYVCLCIHYKPILLLYSLLFSSNIISRTLQLLKKTVVVNILRFYCRNRAHICIHIKSCTVRWQVRYIIVSKNENFVKALALALQCTVLISSHPFFLFGVMMKRLLLVQCYFNDVSGPRYIGISVQNRWNKYKGRRAKLVETQRKEIVVKFYQLPRSIATVIGPLVLTCCYRCDVVVTSRVWWEAKRLRCCVIMYSVLFRVVCRCSQVVLLCCSFICVGAVFLLLVFTYLQVLPCQKFY